MKFSKLAKYILPDLVTDIILFIFYYDAFFSKWNSEPFVFISVIFIFFEIKLFIKNYKRFLNECVE